MHWGYKKENDAHIDESRISLQQNCVADFLSVTDLQYEENKTDSISGQTGRTNSTYEII